MTVTLTRVGYCEERAWLADRSSLFRTVRFPAMIAIIRHERLGTILFDTGYGRALAEAPSAAFYRRILPFTLPERERLPARLKQFDAEHVDLVFLSHFHPDHIGGLREVPGAPPMLHSRQGLRKLQSLQGLALKRSAYFAELLPEDFETRARAIEDLPRADSGGLGEGFDVAGDGSLIAIALPGHAAGQYGLLCRLDNGARVFLCADAAWLRVNITDAKARPAWPVRLLVDDYGAYNDTLNRLESFRHEHPDIRIVPSHCEESIGPLD